MSELLRSQTTSLSLKKGIYYAIVYIVKEALEWNKLVKR